MPTKSNLMGSGCPALQAVASLGIVSTGLSATSAASQNSATLPTDFNVYTTVTLNNGPTLPLESAQNTIADQYIIVNHGANSMNVWPPTGGKIGTGSANAALAVPAGKTAWFLHIGSGNYAASVSA